MSIKYKMQVQDDLLLVTTSGADDDLEEVKNYGLAVIDAAVQGKCKRILCDEVNLEYRIGTIDTFESASFIAAQAPYVVKVALVCNSKGIEDAKFWETVAVNRGLTVRVFQNIAIARNWLDD
jgi:hypothetical protein